MINFVIDDEDTKRYLEWKENHICKLKNSCGGAIGGKITFSFTGTSLGEIQIVECVCGEKLDLSHYKDW